MTTYSTLLRPILVSILCAAILVFGFRFHLRAPRPITRELHWRHPTLAAIVNVLLQALGYLIVAWLVTLVIALVAGRLAARPAWPWLPAMSAIQVRALDLPAFSQGWPITCAVVLFLALRHLRMIRRLAIWDVFISYKSEDVATVRAVVDQLIAAGLRVWFAEYQVVLRRRERFQAAIDDGIRNSAAAILFTNDLYIDSGHCQDEAEKLLARLEPSRVLEIMLPREDGPHSRLPALAGCPSFEGGDVAGILARLRELSGFPVDAPETAAVEPKCGQARYEGVCLGQTLLLDTTGWRITEEGKIDAAGNTRGVEFQYSDDPGGSPLFMNLYCGRELAPQGQRQEQATDDREMYNLLLKHARFHTNRLLAHVNGVHLFFHHGLSQMALTYYMRIGFYWTRKYSIVIPCGAGPDNAEFVFTFGYLGSFRGYCRHTGVMDALVGSLRWT